MPDATDQPGGLPTAAPPVPPVEPRQRWRLVVARVADAAGQAQRDTAAGWEAAVGGARLPVAVNAAGRPRISFGAPLPQGMAAEAELIDIQLVERWPAWRVREALEPVVPAGWRLVGLHDVWLAGPPLAGRVAAADYRIELDGGMDLDADRISTACTMFLAARRVPRIRRKGDGTVEYDLRALVLDVRVARTRPSIVLAARTRFDPELGTGRPEEVVAALGDLIGTTLEARSTIRERLLLAEDLG